MKTLKIAGISIIIFMFITLLSIMFSVKALLSNPSALLDKTLLNQAIADAFPLPLMIISTIFSLILSVLFYAGFIKIGELAKNNFLVIVSWIIMFVILISTISTGLFSYQLIYKNSQSTALPNLQILINIIFLISSILFFILLGVSLLKSKDKIEMSKTTGILYIISGATMIIVVGSLLLWVTHIFAALMFFKASKKFEK